MAREWPDRRGSSGSQQTGADPQPGNRSSLVGSPAERNVIMQGAGQPVALAKEILAPG
jgi:hypothetical protein